MTEKHTAPRHSCAFQLSTHVLLEAFTHTLRHTQTKIEMPISKQSLPDYHKGAPARQHDGLSRLETLNERHPRDEAPQGVP